MPLAGVGLLVCAAGLWLAPTVVWSFIRILLTVSAAGLVAYELLLILLGLKAIGPGSGSGPALWPPVAAVIGLTAFAVAIWWF